MKQNKPQNKKNYRQLTPAHHFILVPLGIFNLLAALFLLWRIMFGDQDYALEYVLLFSISLAAFLLTILSRWYGITLQDRIIRTEENVRHFILTGKPLDARLTLSQIIALRFASDQEFPELAAHAVETGIKGSEIKELIKDWRADHKRV